MRGNKSIKKKKIENAVVRFEEIFEPTLKERLRQFLESDKSSVTITKGLLVAATFGAILSVGVAAPGLFMAFRGMDFSRRPKITSEGFKRLRKALYELKRQKYIEFVEEKEGEEFYRITEKGKMKLRKFSFDNLGVPKPKNWDGKWRLIVFDIPHSKKQARDALREKLIDLDCYQLQKSVWVHPFPCQEEIFYVANVFEVSNFIEVFTVEDFNDSKALYHFRGILQEFL